jgi:hypothetical protein
MVRMAGATKATLARENIQAEAEVVTLRTVITLPPSTFSSVMAKRPSSKPYGSHEAALMTRMPLGKQPSCSHESAS